MRILTDIAQIDQQQWDQLVVESSTATWFQTHEAYDFYASQQEIFTPFVVAVERNLDNLIGVIVGYVTRENNALKQFFTRRAIIYGGPLLAENITNAELKALLLAVRKMKDKGQRIKEGTLQAPIYVEMRNFNDYSRWKETFEACGFAYQPHLNFHIDTTDEDIVKKNLGRGRRRELKIALLNGVQIIEQPTLEQVRDYYAILQKLYRSKIHLPLFSRVFFERLWELPSAHFLLIAKENQIIGGTVCMELAGKCVYEWFACGEDEDFRTCYPSTMGTYAGMIYAATHTCPRFDMMGAGKPNEGYGVRNFKEQFGGTLVEHGRFLCVRNRLLYWIGCLGVRVKKLGL